MIESTSILIALALTFAPSASGSKNTLAHLFFEDPNWIYIAVTYYVAANIMLGALAVAFLVWMKANK